MTKGENLNERVTITKAANKGFIVTTCKETKAKPGELGRWDEKDQIAVSTQDMMDIVNEFFNVDPDNDFNEAFDESVKKTKDEGKAKDEGKKSKEVK